MSGDTNGFLDVFETLRPQGPFVRGDANMNGTVTTADSTLISDWLFFGGPTPDSLDASDANDDGAVGVADITAIINFINNGTPLPCPFSTPQPLCSGRDPTADALTSARVFQAGTTCN